MAELSAGQKIGGVAIGLTGAALLAYVGREIFELVYPIIDTLPHLVTLAEPEKVTKGGSRIYDLSEMWDSMKVRFPAGRDYIPDNEKIFAHVVAGLFGIQGYRIAKPIGQDVGSAVESVGKGVSSVGKSALGLAGRLGRFYTKKAPTKSQQ